MRHSVAMLLCAALLTACGTETPVVSHAAPSASASRPLTDAGAVGALIADRLRSHKGVRVVRVMPAPATMSFTLYQATPDSPFAIEEQDASAPGGPGGHLIDLDGFVYTSQAGGGDLPPVARPWTKWPSSMFDRGLGVRMLEIVLNHVELSQLGPLAAAGRLTSTTEEPLGTHYTVRIDLADPVTRLDHDRVFRAVYAQAALKDATSRRALPEAKDLLTVKPETSRLLKRSTVTMDLWVDRRGLPVKYVNTFAMPGDTTRTELAFSDWGRVPPIQPPPADKVKTYPG
ncbi:MAG: hypothetical protein HOV97_44575 [Nonomuraea sp.]|nr:hypothetical protein [Nonomuraea sp.]